MVLDMERTLDCYNGLSYRFPISLYVLDTNMLAREYWLNIFVGHAIRAVCDDNSTREFCLDMYGIET
jgi:hypothetical protein